MLACQRCNKFFPTAWRLKRHMNSKAVCSELILTNIEKEQCLLNELFKFKSLYCAKGFKLNTIKVKHESTCGERNDTVRRKEIKLGVQMNTFYDKTCRFCDKTFSYRWRMRNHYNCCNKRNDYLDKLCDFQNGQNKVNIVNNGIPQHTIIHNNNTFNVVVNSYDETDRIMRDLPKLVCNWIIQDQMRYGRNDTKWTTGCKMLTKTHLHPPNRNIRVTNERSKSLEVFDGGVYQRRVADEVIDECLLHCKNDLENIIKENIELVSRSQLINAIESFADTLTSAEYKEKHKRSVMNSLFTIK